MYVVNVGMQLLGTSSEIITDFSAQTINDLFPLFSHLLFPAIMIMNSSRELPGEGKGAKS